MITGYELFFAMYIPLYSESRFEYAGSYETIQLCVDASFGEKRKEIKIKYPKAGISAYCIPSNVVLNTINETEKSVIKEFRIKNFGWH